MSRSNRSSGRVRGVITSRSNRSPAGRLATVADGSRRARPPETPELRRLRRRIDVLDRRIVTLLNERAALARDAGRAKTAAG
ncbi:MAG: chorismate mutase, partial [Candidatus Limnocylindrales bacterium]